MMKRRAFIGLLMGSVLGLAALAVHGAEGEAAPAFVPLAAKYEESRGSGHGSGRVSRWYFVRGVRQVELGRGAYVELWGRDDGGEVSWQRIFHDERKLIAYTPGELRTQRRAPAWEVLNTIIDERLLTSLRRVGSASFNGRQATRYRGQVGEERIEVIWLEKEKLPVEVSRRDRHHAYRLRLLELRALPGRDWPRADLARAADYEYIDGADLGDREYDPFVRKVLAVDEAYGAGGHAH